MTKICSKCKKKKSFNKFYKRKGSKDGFTGVCKQCIRTKENLKSKRKANLKHLYDLNLEQYQELFNAQNGCCAICEKHQSKFKEPLGIDHNHKTGLIRGLLCHKCNVGLGYYETWKFKSEKYLKEIPKRMIKIYKKWMEENDN